MNAIIYVRVSTTEQVDGYSLKTQEEICRDYAKRNNYNILEVFIEKGESAKTANRTELLNMFDYLKKNKNIVNYLIVHKIDRLSRNTIDTLNMIVTLNGLGVELKSVSEPIDKSPFGKFITTITSSYAQLDNDIRAERTVIGMKQAVK
ncbi:MAG: recombinase family protein, partial [Actinobacteria bacterium]|nr:recombinase family protein [Actinomycetota bacterium]